jgi:ubiquinol-cytochrome c reductase cytochrome b subunit
MKKSIFLLMIVSFILVTFSGLTLPHGPKGPEESATPLGFGYIGLEPEGVVDEEDLNAFRHGVMEEAYAKAKVDKVRFVVIALLLAVVYLSVSKHGGLGATLRAHFEWHSLGTVAGMILLFLVVPTGIIIATQYNPSPWQTYSSVEHLTLSPGFAFIRNLHNWSAELFLIVLLLHAARTIASGTYLGNRKIIWLTGSLILVIGWVTFLAGSFMRGDQEGVEGFKHIMYGLTTMPLGGYIAEFLSGELAVMRLMVFHISMALFAVILLAATHILMRKGYVHVQKHWRRAAIYTLVVVGLLVVQSLMMEAPFVRGMDAGPAVSGVEITKPPWPIYFIVAWENVFGASTMLLTPGVVFLVLILFPFLIERVTSDKQKQVRLGRICFYLGTFLLVAISYWAASGVIIAHIF